MKKKALIVGINEYEDSGFERLKYAQTDAEAIHDLLINPDIGGFIKEEAIFLKETTKSEIEENLEIILSEAKRDDLAFIYFAGHGKLDSLGGLCLVVRNTKIDRLLATSVHLEYIRRIIDQSNCKRIVFIIDSCFSGAIGQSFRSGEVPAESFEQISGQGKVIISASQAYERARELDELKHGIFTYYLARGLAQGEADYDGDGFISIEDLYRYVYNNVKAVTKGKQIPVKWGIDEKGEIIIAKSIKVLERKKAEIESLLKKAQELKSQGKFDEALECLEKILQLSSASIEAQQEIIKIKKEQKRRAEIEIKTDKLFEYYQQGYIPADIYNKAVKVVKNPCYTLSDKIFSRLIDDLLSNSLSMENFLISWDRAEKPKSQIEKEEKQEEKYKDQSQGQTREEKHHSSYEEKIEEISKPPPKYYAKKLKTFKWTKWAAFIGLISLIGVYNYFIPRIHNPVKPPGPVLTPVKYSKPPMLILPADDQQARQLLGMTVKPSIELAKVTLEKGDLAKADTNRDQAQALVEQYGSADWNLKNFTDQQARQLSEVIVKNLIGLGEVALNKDDLAKANLELSSLASTGPTDSNQPPDKAKPKASIKKAKAPIVAFRPYSKGKGRKLGRTITEWPPYTWHGTVSKPTPRTPTNVVNPLPPGHGDNVNGK